jgi:hypothetical protein
MDIPAFGAESQSPLSTISHVTLENQTWFLSFLLNFIAASGNHQELSPTWQHGMALHQPADGGDSLQVWRVAANIFNNHWQTAKKGRVSMFGVG